MRIADRAPSGQVTDCDRRYLGLYAELIDAADQGIDWREAAVEVLELSLEDEAEAYACWDSYVGRARWIISDGLADAIVTFGGPAALKPTQ